MRYSVFCMAGTKGEPVSSLEMWGGQEETGNSAREAMLASSADRQTDPSLEHSLDPSNCFCCSCALCSLRKLLSHSVTQGTSKNQRQPVHFLAQLVYLDPDKIFKVYSHSSSMLLQQPHWFCSESVCLLNPCCMQTTKLLPGDPYSHSQMSFSLS